MKASAYNWLLGITGALVMLAIIIQFGVLLPNSPGQLRRNEMFFEQRLRPLAEFVRDFQIKEKRLPTQSEFGAWEKRMKLNGDYYSSKPPNQNEWGREGVDFIVGAWRGEWAEYFQSWDGKVFQSDGTALRHALIDE